MNSIHLSARSLVSDHWYQRHAEKANDLGNNPRQVFVERAPLVAGALSIECKQSEQSIGVVAMVDAVLTHQNIPTGYRLLPTADTPSFLRGLSLSLSLSLKPGLDLISRTASIDSVSLFLLPCFSPPMPSVHFSCPTTAHPYVPSELFRGQTPARVTR